MAVVAMLAIAGAAVAQEQADEQRIAELNKQLNDDRQWELAIGELGKLRGDDAVRFLDLQLTPGFVHLERVSEVFRRIGEDAEPVLARLVEVFNESADYDRRFRSLELFAEIAPWHRTGKAHAVKLQGFSGNDARILWTRLNSRLVLDPREEELESFILMLDGGNPYQRRFAAQILSTRGSSAHEAIPALKHVLERDPGRWAGAGYPFGSETVPVNDEVAGAILAIEPRGEAAIDAHIHRMAFGGSERERIESEIALGHFGPLAARATRHLIKRAERGSMEAITALGLIGPEARAAVPVLEDWLKWGPRLSGSEGIQLTERVKVSLRQIRGR